MYVEIVIKEKMSVMALDEDVAAQIMMDHITKDEDCDIYTHVYKLP